jgi:uncharacterized protein YndB with AHSA1/START domain
MKNSLLFDFTVDKPANRVFVNREFAAGLDLVWNAFTEQKILDQWWAPKPWLSMTKDMNFQVGGRRLYAMCSPEGEEHWSTQDYTAIAPKSNFKFTSSFSDKDAVVNTQLPQSEWSLDFSETEGVTTVKITIQHKTLADLEQLIQMGFQGGFTMTLNYLDGLLKALGTR